MKSLEKKLALSKKEIEDYFENNEEAMQEIKERYKAYSEQYEKGELSDNLIDSCASSVAYCLYMMY